MAVNGGHAGTKKGPNWGQVKNTEWKRRAQSGHFGSTVRPKYAWWKHDAPTGSIATPKPHLGVIPLPGSQNYQKNPRDHENKTGTPPPKYPPPLKTGILWAWVFPAKNAFCQAPIKLAQPLPAPELLAKYFTDMRIFLKLQLPTTSEPPSRARDPYHI